MNIGSLITSLGFSVDHGSKKMALASVNQVSSALGSLARIGMGAGALFAVGSMTQYVANMEMLASQFGVMMRDMEQGKEFTKTLREMAAITPFETMDLAGAARLMMTFGAETQNVTGYLKMLGDVTMGDKVRFNQVNLAFSQMLSAGKLMGQDLLQMTTGGYNPLRTIAEMTNKSYQQVLSEMFKGNITPDMVIAALQKDTSEGGKFFKGMIEGAKTLNGLVSTLKDNVFLLGLEFGNRILPIIKEIIAGAILWLDDVKQGVTDFADAFANLATGVVENAKEIVRAIVVVAKSAMDAIGSLATGSASMFGAMKQALFAAVWAAAPLAQSLVDLIGNLFKSVGDGIDGNITTFEGFFTLLRRVSEFAAALVNIVSSVAGAIIYVVSNMMIGISKMVDFVSEVLQSFSKGNLLNTINDMMESITALEAVIGAVTVAIIAMNGAAIASTIALSPMIATYAAIAVSAGIAAVAIQKIHKAWKFSSDENATDREREAMGWEKQLEQFEKAKEKAEKKLAYMERNRGQYTKEQFSQAERDVRNANFLVRGAEEGLSKVGGSDSGALGFKNGFKEMLEQFKGSGDSNLQKLIDQMEASLKKMDIKQFNSVTVKTTVDDKGKTQLSPEALEASLDAAARSLFDIRITKIASMAL